MNASYRIIVSILWLIFAQASLAVGAIQYQITGLPSVVKDNVEKSLDALLPDAKDTLKPDLQHYYLQIPKQIQSAMKPYGYFKVDIKAHLNSRRKPWRARFDVKPGPRMHWGAVDIRLMGPGYRHPKLLTVLRQLPIKQHHALNSEDYEGSKQALLQVAQAHGFLHAKFVKSELHVDLAHYEATALLHFDTGPQYRIGAITFKQHVLSERLLRRLVPFKVGEIYTDEKIASLQHNLMSSGYFSQILVEAQKQDPRQRHIPIVVTLKGRKRQHYALGGGYATDTGPRMNVQASFNRLNKRGHRLDVGIRGAQRQTGFHANYTLPGHDPLTDQYSLSADIENSLLGSGDRFTKSFSIESKKQRHGWQRALRLIFLQERFQLPFKAPRSATLLMPNLNLKKIQKDDLVDPNEGYSIELDLRTASQSVLSTTSFLQARINLKGLYTFAEHNRLIGRFSIGATAVSSINYLPLSQQFRSGGTASVRGYGFEKLGPGRYLLESSLEYQRRIKGAFYLATFFDAGNAMNQWGPTLRRGVGLAGIWRSAIGAIRVGAAHGLDQPGRPVQIFFSMGPEL